MQLAEQSYSAAVTETNADAFALQEQFLNDYNHCCLCGDELIFTHVTNFIGQDVKEEAHCPSCKVKTKEHHHTLQ